MDNPIEQQEIAAAQRPDFFVEGWIQSEAPRLFPSPNTSFQVPKEYLTYWVQRCLRAENRAAI